MLRSVVSRVIVFLSILSLTFYGGCKTKDKLSETVYFNDHKDSALALQVVKNEFAIMPNDVLGITVTALDPASVAPFNMVVTRDVLTSGYTVQADGTIKFPQLGKIFVKGFNRNQLADSMSHMVSKYVNEPIVNIQFLNSRITVLGEVGRPGVYPIAEGKATILDILGVAGDFTSFARRDNVLIIREKEGVRSFGNINMLSLSSFSSPYFILQQNDVVYVEPNKTRSQDSNQSFYRNVSLVTSVVSLFSTLLFLVLNITK